MKSFIIALSVVSLVYGQDMTNGQQFQQQQQQLQQQQQMFEHNQNLNFRSAEVPNEQKSAPGGQTVQAFIVSSNGQHQEHHMPQHQQEQILQVVGQSHPGENVVVQLGNPGIKVQAVSQPQPQIVKVVEEKPVHHNEPVCHLFQRKGECVSIPSYFGCIRSGGVLFMSFSECGFNTGFGCCVKNIIPFLSQSK